MIVFNLLSFQFMCDNDTLNWNKKTLTVNSNIDFLYLTINNYTDYTYIDYSGFDKIMMFF